MLNQFRIGTKLVAGFAIMLILLGAVWQLGRWASSEKTKSLHEVEIADKLTSAALTMERDILDALISAKDESITRKEEHAKKVQAKAKDIITEHENDIKLMVSTDAIALYRVILGKVNKFAEIDANYWQTEAQRKLARNARSIASARAADGAANFRENAYETTMKSHLRTDGDGTFVPLARLEMTKILGDLVNALQSARRECLRYETEREEANRPKIYADIQAEFGKIKTEHDKLESLVSDAGIEMLAQLDADVNTWKEAAEAMIQQENELARIDAEQTALVDELIGDIGETLKIFAHRAEEAEELAGARDYWVQCIQFALCIGAMFFGVLISWTLTVNIAAGLKTACGHMQHIAHEGDVSIDIPESFLERKDEVGDLAYAVKAIQDHFRDVENLADNLARHDYSVEAKVCSEKDTMSINLNKMVQEISDAVHEINESARQVATGSNEVSSAAQSLSSGSQEMAASLEEITASMQEISSQTKANAENASQARDLAKASSEVAIEGQTVMHELIGAMERITENSHEIQRVIKVVDDIAFQTNLLALNAAVEAARAGQHGKGFAVVAEEVRNLASRSAQAAQETAELIAKSSQEIQRGDEIAAHTAGVFDTIVSQIRQTTDLVAGIAIASNEQAQGVGQVSIGLHQIDGVTQTNTASAEESASAANEMSSMAKNLQELVGKFKLREATAA